MNEIRVMEKIARGHPNIVSLRGECDLVQGGRLGADGIAARRLL